MGTFLLPPLGFPAPHHKRQLVLGRLAGMLGFVALFLSWFTGGTSRGEDDISPVTIALPAGSGAAQVTRYADHGDWLEFVVDADERICLRVHPQRFPIAAGKDYSINTSYFDPLSFTVRWTAS